ncbi:bifunctional riboflavin kinase/FAD synthetase [Shimia abyssi]|uniref:Riboflavin biosynthesis protein n=1 Tax=Shimia abyssi TaxID=1662395 RepID=A0A2P8F7H9_9RHOB|nr:bifunctional riboflavin kinase/FAD synthetase [Shimia abyssi]PSL17668.1 FMN adenylyltransferase /riboflavin kinase [Shimia abyssi]
MKIIRDYQFVAKKDRGASAAIGNFDGVHLGHQSVIEIARNADTNAPMGIVTFEPHPREFFAPDAPPFRLTGADTRALRLEKLGVEFVYELPFNATLSSLTPREFARDVIADGLGLSHVVVGADFCFGKSRSGTAADLRIFGKEFGFGVTVAPLLQSGENQVSSTSIRAALSNGNPREAARMLGHWHRISGPVIGGDQRGRNLGYPTANMSLDGLHPPRFGVYAVLVDVLEGPHSGSYQGASSIGIRPMFGANKANIETYIFDFSGDLYGTPLSIALVDFLRPEEKYDSLEALVAQIEKDCAECRAILTAL